MSIDSNAAAQTVSFHYTLPGARTKGTIGEGCLLLVLIGFSTLERAVPRTPRCRPFFELAGGRRLSTFIEENQELGSVSIYRGRRTCDLGAACAL